MADIHGTLTALTERTMGDAFDTSATAGTQTLSLYDVSDFDEDGGAVLIGGAVYLYDSVDMDADTIHITTGLISSASTDDPVLVWNVDQGIVVTEQVALVTVDGQEDGDPITAEVAHALRPLLAQGTLAQGQSVTLTQDGVSYRVTEAHGKTNKIVQVNDAASIYSGVGSPAFAATVGDIYFRTDDPSTSGHRIYIFYTILGWTGIV